MLDELGCPAGVCAYAHVGVEQERWLDCRGEQPSCCVYTPIMRQQSLASHHLQHTAAGQAGAIASKSISWLANTAGLVNGQGQLQHPPIFCTLSSRYIQQACSAVVQHCSSISLLPSTC
jgi:hypothetical protein